MHLIHISGLGTFCEQEFLVQISTSVMHHGGNHCPVLGKAHTLLLLHLQQPNSRIILANRVSPKMTKEKFGLHPPP